MHVNDTLDLPNLQAIIARFHTMYDRGEPNDCWVWKRAQSHNGYGLFTVGHHQQVRAHRFAYVIAKGPIPREKSHAHDTSYNLQMRHRCHNPLCVNPRHLIPGTAKENFQDKIEAARRYGVGEDNYAAKLTTEKVAAIRQDPRRAKDIAVDYGVSVATIGKVLRGKSWRSVKVRTAVRPVHRTGAPGAANGRTNLTDDDVRAIRKDNRRYPVIASQYGIGRESVGNIKRRVTWKTVCDL